MSPSHRIVLVGGGTRSGKSSFALGRAEELGQRRAFVATATRTDDDMAARIERHRRDRPEAFTTFEAPYDLADCLGRLDGFDVVVIDCLTVFIANLLVRAMPEEQILAEVDRVGQALTARRFSSVVVTNEVGMSVHAPTAIGRAFVDVCGFAHQRLGRIADEVHLAVLGVVVPIKPSR
jgi:adenosylcobinamide kinase/adenosylcobinamide-phosphate guanylyltransferase